MKEKFQIDDASVTILDILNTMISPEAEQTNSVTQSAVACAKESGRRKKRESETEARQGNNQIKLFLFLVRFQFITPSGFCLHLAGSEYKKYLHLRGDYLPKKGEGSYRSQSERGKFFCI